MMENNQGAYSTPPNAHKVSSRVIFMTVVLFALIIFGMFVFAYLKNTEQQVTLEEQKDEQPVEDRYSNITRIDGKHYFIDGVHTIVGEILMPTPCDLLEGEAIVAESFPEQITLDFTVINNAESCTQVVTPARYKISATASEEATFSALFNSRRVELNLIPAAEGELPEDFEVFIKG